MNALVVDDNFYNRDLCALALTHVGYNVVQACAGKMAVDLLAQYSFSLLVLDLHMPEMGGLDVIRIMKHAQDRDRMTLIVMTAHPHMASSEEIYEGADYVIYKPINIESFAQLARRLTSGAAV